MIAQLLLKHRDQFVAMGLPTHLHHSACQKISSQTFDAGAFFQFQEAEMSSDDSYDCNEDALVTPDDEDISEEDLSDEGIGHSVSTKYSLAACNQLKGEGAVILIDHMWLVAFI